MSTADEVVPQGGSTRKAVVPLRYVVWPLARRDAWRGAPPWMAIIAAVSTLILTGSLAMAALSLVIMIAATWRFFLPARYAVDGQGVHVQALGRTRLIRWNVMRRIEPLADRMVIQFVPGSFNGPIEFEVPFDGHRAEALGWVERFATSALQPPNPSR